MRSVLLNFLLYTISFGLNAADVLQTFDERPVINVDSSGVYRVVYDIHTDALSAGTSRGLYYARGLFEAFGVKAKSSWPLRLRRSRQGKNQLVILVTFAARAQRHHPEQNNDGTQITRGDQHNGAAQDKEKPHDHGD